LGTTESFQRKKTAQNPGRFTAGHLSDYQQGVVNDLYRNELTQTEIAARHMVTVSAISLRVKTIHRQLAADLAA
jgi:DNA-directed RNA polymerase specialized sigma subunit